MLWIARSSGKRQHLAAPVVLAALCFAVTGCATTQDRVANREDLLAAAGFTVLPANTPERANELATLPANKFIIRPHDNQMDYVYADPVVCGCLYIGNQQAYNAFQHELFERRLANQQEMTAMMYDQPWGWDGWNWGPWGPGWW